MKSQIWQKFLMAPRLRKSDIALTLIPALLWVGLIHARQFTLNPRCARSPGLCSPLTVPSMDRLALGIDQPGADGFSYATQNISGFLAILVPPIWNFGLAMTARLDPVTAAFATGTDWVLFAQGASWNGMLTEVSHLVAQRPRPFVYSDPGRAGADPAHYTSFYSGHTSFAAVATVSLFLILLSRGAPWIVLLLGGMFSETLVILTALFRVLSGRHFPSDVVVGAVAGTLVAIFVFYYHKPTASSRR